MDPVDAADFARRVRAAVVEETPRRWWVLPAAVLLVLTIAGLVATVLRN